MTFPLHAVWDIEAAQWDQFVMGAVWDARDDVTHVYDDEDDLAEHLLSLPKGATAWAHAGGRYDVLWLLDWCRRKRSIPEATIRLSGSTVASLAIKGGPVLRDSCRLMPMALARACLMFPGCAVKERLGFPCICGDDCGGYCSITTTMVGAARARLRAYLEHDVVALRDTLRELDSYAEAHGITLAGTVASSGWKTAQRTCGLPNAQWDLEAYRRSRAGYFGGRCEPHILEAPLVYFYDRKQAYPAALCRPVPVGEPSMLGRKNAGRHYGRGAPGIYYAAVTVPEMMAPPLPVRLRDRVVYPHGLVFGSWPRDELRRAEEVGCTVERVHGGVSWEREEACIEPYMRKCFALREAATGNDPLREWLKFLANSPTGGFAQDPEHDIVVIGDFADDPDYEPVGRYDWIWRRGVFSIPTRGHVHWAATLTADARVELHRQIEHAGDDWVYSDTDSCPSLRPLTRNVGTGLGEWAFEGTDPWLCLAPKVYKRGDVPTKGKVKAKGIPKAEKVWPAIMAGERIPLDRGVDSLLMAARGGGSLFQRRSGSRQVKPRADWCGARLRDGNRTRAPSMDDLALLPR